MYQVVSVIANLEVQIKHDDFTFPLVGSFLFLPDGVVHKGVVQDVVVHKDVVLHPDPSILPSPSVLVAASSGDIPQSPRAC